MSICRNMCGQIFHSFTIFISNTSFLLPKDELETIQIYDIISVQEYLGTASWAEVAPLESVGSPVYFDLRDITEKNVYKMDTKPMVCQLMIQ